MLFIPYYAVINFTIKQVSKIKIYIYLSLQIQYIIKHRIKEYFIRQKNSCLNNSINV